jgi:hypothetical protein
VIISSSTSASADITPHKRRSRGTAAPRRPG